MRRTLLALTIVAGAVGGMSLANHGENGKGVKTLSQNDITEKVDGKKSKATMVEVTLGPGESDAPHRHPGPGFGYVLEGEYEWAIDNNKAKILKVGDTFYPQVVAVSNHGGTLWPQVHTHAGKLWLDWIDSADEMAWIRLLPLGSWSPTQYEVFLNTVQLEFFVRGKIRTAAIQPQN